MGVWRIVEVANGLGVGGEEFAVTILVSIGLTDVRVGDELQPPNPYSMIDPVRSIDSLQKFEFIVLVQSECQGIQSVIFVVMTLFRAEPGSTPRFHAPYTQPTNISAKISEAVLSWPNV